MKRVLSFLLAVCLLFSVIPAFSLEVSADGLPTETISGSCGENLTWTLTPKGVLTISGTGVMSTYTIGSYTLYAPPWYDYRAAITTIVLENGITTIGNNAFYECSNVTGTLTIPDSVTSIGSYAFYNCSGFTEALTIPDSVTSIGSYAFYNCSGFTGALTIPNNITNIRSYTFYNCSGLTGTLVIPDGVTSIGTYAFSGCSSFTGSLIIPNTVTSIGTGAFSKCSGFTGALSISDGVSSVSDYTFAGCSGFTGTLTIPDGVTSIGDGAFEDCSGFTGSLTIPDGVISIGNGGIFGAFSGCSGFNGTLTLPDSVTKIGDRSFLDCSGFTGSLIIPDSVTSIGCNAFSGCSGFNGSLILSEKLTSISDWAFLDCSGLTGTLTIPDSVTTIGEAAFSGCSGFTGDLILPDGITSIESAAFEGCSGFNGLLHIPSKLTSIADYSFSLCENLGGSLTLPKGITSIGACAFQSCRNFTGSLYIPGNVSSIDIFAFRYCNFDGIYFKEDAPTVIAASLTSASFPTDMTLYYIEGKSGWTDSEYYDADAGTWNGYKLAVWDGIIPGEDIPSPDPVESAKIVAYYPVNGSTTVSAADVNGTYGLMVQYDSEIAAKNNQVILNWDAEPFCVWRAKDDVLVYSAAQFGEGLEISGEIQWRASDPDTVHIKPYNSVFEEGTEYYVTVGEGFFTTSDGNPCPAIEKGDWVFSTQKIVYENVPIIVIPGIMGSKLYEDASCTNTVWGTMGSFLEVWVQNGAMLDINNILYTKKLVKENNLKEKEYGSLDTYENLINFLCETYPERDIYFYSYDWRQSNIDSANELNNLLKKHGIEHFDLICHSMGGLVAAQYVASGYSGYEHIITLGTPYEGAPRLLNAVLTYKSLDSDVLTSKNLLSLIKAWAGNFILSISGLSTDVKSRLPGVAELSPTVSYWSSDMEDNTLYEMTGIFKRINHGNSAAYYLIALEHIFGVSGEQNLVNAQTRVQNAAETLLNSDSAYFAFGTSKYTIGGLCMTMQRNGRVTVNDVNYCQGDGTVPVNSSNVMLQLSVKNSRDFDLDHSGLAGGGVDDTNSEWIRLKGWIMDILSNSEDTASIKESTNRTHTVLRVACPVDVKIERNGEVLTNYLPEYCDDTSFGVMDLIGAEGEIKMFCVDSANDYSIILQGNGTGTMDYTIRFYSEDNELIEERTFEDVEITPTTVISTNSGMDTETKLEIDYNGDGKIDETLVYDENRDLPITPSASNASDTSEKKTADTNFSDVSASEWYYTAVQYVVENGLMNGTSSTQFAPNATLTRAMLVQVLYNLEGKPAVGGSSGFTDVASGAWYADAVAWAAEHGIVTGYSETRFGPNDAVTREQTAAIFQRYARYKGYDASASGYLSQFTDAKAVSTYAKDAVIWAVDAGLLSGKGNGALDPAGTATRAEIAAILMRFCENVLR